MKSSLLMIIFLTGSVHSRTIWDLFNKLFGDAADSEEQNSITDDDENGYKEGKSDDNHAGSMENNEIILKEPYTQRKEWKYPNNRVGWSHRIEGNLSTEEGYKSYLQYALEYIRNLSNQDHGLGEGAGPAYTQLHQRFGEYDEFGNLIWDDGEDDFDGGDPDYDGDFDDPDFDYDYWGGHDELK